MIYLKPKEMAERLSITPETVSTYARDIENADIYRFEKYGLRSFLFKEEEYNMLYEYHQIVHFFKKKTIALQVFKEQFELKQHNEKELPGWSHLLKNVKYHI